MAAICKIKKVTKADKRKKSKLENIKLDNGLTTSFALWQTASYESGRRVSKHF